VFLEGEEVEVAGIVAGEDSCLAAEGAAGRRRRSNARKTSHPSIGCSSSLDQTAPPATLDMSIHESKPFRAASRRA
jgi:hypothetical protein